MKFADFRSDTTTHPTKAMRESVLEVPLGDDVYGDDLVTKELEALGASLLGKEAGLFVASGTMGNQLAILAQTNPAEEILCNEHCHIVNYEGGAAPFLSHVAIQTVSNPHHTVLAEQVESGRRAVDIHQPKTSLVCLESPTTMGNVVPLEEMQKTYEKAKELGLLVHLDGARIFHAAIALGIDVKEIANCGDSVMICLSKGLCAPVGSLLLGSQAFIDRCRIFRKKLGGGMRQTGFLAMPGIIALKTMVNRLQEDHDNALFLATELGKLSGVSCHVERTQINMVFANLGQERRGTHLVEEGKKRGLLIPEPDAKGNIRFVTNYYTTRKNCEDLIDLIETLEKP